MELIQLGSRNTSDCLELRNLPVRGGEEKRGGVLVWRRPRYLQLTRSTIEKVSPKLQCQGPVIGCFQTQYPAPNYTALFRPLFCKAQCTCDVFRALSSSFCKFWFRLLGKGELISFLHDGDWTSVSWFAIASTSLYMGHTAASPSLKRAEMDTEKSSFHSIEVYYIEGGINFEVIPIYSKSVGEFGGPFELENSTRLALGDRCT